MQYENSKMKISYRPEKGCLYNGIRIPDRLPQDADPNSDAEIIPPYLGKDRPAVIDITVGRQLFVDSFLLDRSELTTVYHQPEKYAQNPVFRPETPVEKSGEWAVGTSSGGIWYDMDEKKYKMWYDILFNPMLGYAESDDGIRWERVNFREDGTNVVMTEDEKDGAVSIFIDYHAPKEERYKLFLNSFRDHEESGKLNFAPVHLAGGVDRNHYAHRLFVSADGLHWKQKGGLSKGACGDMTTVFYDGFRNKWINSLREYARTTYHGSSYVGRVRYYAEHDRFDDLLNWDQDDTAFWLKCDGRDATEDFHLPNGVDLLAVKPQMYNFDAIGYESVMFGMWQIWHGPENNFCADAGVPKITELMASFSRDGFHYQRPDRTPFIQASRKAGDWDRGYLFNCNGGMIVHRDTIDFYYSGFSGEKEGLHTPHANQSIGMATLRRDGFASLNGRGTVLTHPLKVCKGCSYLFVNLNCPEKAFGVELLNAAGDVISGYSFEDCVWVGGNSTMQQIRWKHGKNTSFLQNQVFSIRFSMRENGEFYSFWFSETAEGDSNGIPGAGYAP